MSTLIQTSEIEKSLIGSLLLVPGIYIEICNYVTPVMFQGQLRPAADLIFAIQAAGKGYDVSMISDAAGWTRDFRKEVVNAAAPAVAEEQAIMLRDAYLSREHSRLLENTNRQLLTGADYWDTVRTLEAEVGLLQDMTEEKDTKAAVAAQCFEEIIRAQKGEAMDGVPTPWEGINRAIGGWQPGTNNIIAARPGMGKTTIVLQCAKYAARKGFPVALFSLEMSEKALLKKFANAEAGILSKDIRNRNLTGEQLKRYEDALSEYLELPIHIIDQQRVSNKVSAICDRIRQLHARKGIKLVIVDYLQLITATKSIGNENYEVQEISRALQRMSAALNLPIITLSQLSRKVEDRGGSKRPQLQDLRGSGSIEQDASIVGFLYRPEYYGITEDEAGNSLKGVLEFILAKHREDGDLGTFLLKWNKGEYVEIEEPDPFLLDNGTLPNGGQVNGKKVNGHNGADLVPAGYDSPIIRNPARNNQDEDIPF